MNILIIEDEILAQKELERLLQKHFPHILISQKITSVASSISYLQQNTVDLIFMDIHLSDGLCFDIFKAINVNTPIIFTTAYDQYAIKAFKVNSIDYLLKPIEETEFCQSLNKFFSLKPKDTSYRINNLLKTYSFKSRFTVKQDDNVLFFEVKNIAYFFSEYKALFLMTTDGQKFLMDNSSLNALEEVLNPKDFFRLSRNCITSINSIKSVSRHFNNRLKVVLKPQFHEDLFVSRLKVPEFLRWLDGEIN